MSYKITLFENRECKYILKEEKIELPIIPSIGECLCIKKENKGKQVYFNSFRIEDVDYWFINGKLDHVQLTGYRE